MRVLSRDYSGAFDENCIARRAKPTRSHVRSARPPSLKNVNFFMPSISTELAFKHLHDTGFAANV